MIAALFALPLALAVGSFLNVVVARVPERRSLNGRSGCPTCSAAIEWYDNVPVVSYIVLRGRCRHCEERISPFYPAIEIVTATLIVASIVRFGPTIYGLLAAVICTVLVALAFIELRHRVVANHVLVRRGPTAHKAATLLVPVAAFGVIAAVFVGHPSAGG